MRVLLLKKKKKPSKPKTVHKEQKNTAAKNNNKKKQPQKMHRFSFHAGLSHYSTCSQLLFALMIFCVPLY